VRNWQNHGTKNGKSWKSNYRKNLYFPHLSTRKTLTSHLQESSHVFPRGFSNLTLELEKVNPAQINAITSSLSLDDQKLLSAIVQQAKANLASQEEGEHSPNGN
jgi:hypothetical protein